ncbi:MAG: hypothetical protein QM532_01410 [Cyanobium sp. MAG06]|nr:hypothetical protein [Cyanobium sp. MAG06]
MLAITKRENELVRYIQAIIQINPKNKSPKAEILIDDVDIRSRRFFGYNKNLSNSPFFTISGKFNIPPNNPKVIPKESVEIPKDNK